MSLTIYPCIDLKDGQVVRLLEGDMNRVTVFSDDPPGQARVFAQAGSQWLHVVDLNGAFAGRPVNSAVVEAVLAAFPGKVQLGGGIRTRATVDHWLGLGIERVVIGTAAMTDPQLVRDAARAYPGRVVVAVDARDGFVTTQGWAEASTVSIAELAARFEDAGVAAVLFTDVGRDGLMKGVNVAASAALADRTRIPVIVSGGAASLADIDAVKAAQAHCTGTLDGVIVGRAIYDGRIDLAQALARAA